MLRMAGVRLNPGTRLLLGFGLLVAGLLVHVTALIVAGAAIGLFGFLSLVGDASGGTRESDSDGMRGR